ncbi:hypothetical protein [Salegentibacter chungangensis]|uniref:Molybdenum ABC transporter permease n=1 Tax=Salegentibacter chungangensis TaxID=1335724 RepID=A0ABW3NU27_9FLAO
MGKISATTVIIAVSVFLMSFFIYWKVMRYYSKKELGEKMYNQWNARLYFWQGAIFTSTGITFLIMFLLKWANVLTF